MMTTTCRICQGNLINCNHERKIVSDALGFRLEVAIYVGPLNVRGRHRTYEDQSGTVSADTPHRIEISSAIEEPSERAEVIAHEVYHLFRSVRDLITVDEETETTVFGQLVSRVHRAVEREH